MKNSIVTIAMAMMLSVTAVVGFGVPVKAANTVDKWFSYSNDKPAGSSSWRDKQNDSKVYVYPTTGPKINYEVNGRKKIASTEQYKSFQGSYAHAIPTGTKASITNWVNESGGTEARLLMGRISSSLLDTAGYWSPDSSRNYTIFG